MRDSPELSVGLVHHVAEIRTTVTIRVDHSHWSRLSRHFALIGYNRGSLRHKDRWLPCRESSIIGRPWVSLISDSEPVRRERDNGVLAFTKL